MQMNLLFQIGQYCTTLGTQYCLPLSNLPFVNNNIMDKAILKKLTRVNLRKQQENYEELLYYENVQEHTNNWQYNAPHLFVCVKMY
jgi:hypothetical protein